MILIIQRATSPDPARAKEFADALASNQASGLFEHIELVEGRPEITDLFRLAGKFAGHVVVLANSDITFDESIRLAEDIGLREFYCISRWEPEGLRSWADSHDAWVFRPPCAIVAPFQLGRFGCDGRLAWLVKDAGYTVSNPCHSIKLLHHHASGVRTYSRNQWIEGEYAEVPQCALAPKIKPARIAVYTVARNEAQFVERWAASCREADVRLILDTGSTDDTAARARALGVTVAEARVTPWRFDDARNTALALLPPDIDLCVSLDMDEVLLPGWRAELEAAHAAGATRVAYHYAWTVDAAGQPDHVFRTDKIHGRSGYRWQHPIHEAIVPTGPETRHESQLWIHHLADNTKPRTQYLPLLEQAARETPDCFRTLYYLAREYTLHGRPADAAPIFERYLTLSTWPVERAHACLHLAQCQPQRRHEWLLRAQVEQPNRREVLCALAAYYADVHNWEMAYAAGRTALRITQRTADYLTEPRCWSWLPYDRTATAAYWLGLKNTAIELGEKALALLPGDERLLRNMEFYKGEQQAFP